MNTPDTEVWVCKECEQYGEIRQGYVHNIKAMNCRVKPSDPVFFDTTTPDTEESCCCDKCNNCHIADYSEPTPPQNPVPTEWENEFINYVWEILKQDSNDLRKQQAILHSLRTRLTSPHTQAQEIIRED